MSPSESLALKMHATRLEVERLRREMAACQCQFELGADLAKEVDTDRMLAGIEDADRRPDPDESERKPCWKGSWYHSDPWGGTEYRTVGESRPGGWCLPCRVRQAMLAPYEKAKRSLAALKGAFWRAAKRLAEAQS